MCLTCKDWQRKGSLPNIQLLPSVGIFWLSSQFIALILRGVTIFYLKDIFIEYHLCSSPQQGAKETTGLQGWRGWFETPDMARHRNILNSIEIVLTVRNIFSVAFLSFSYLSSLISHIEKGYGFVQDRVPKTRWFTYVQEYESAKQFASWFTKDVCSESMCRRGKWGRLV